MMDSSHITLLGLDRAELTSLAVEMGEPAYRGQQLSAAVYQQRLESVGEISTLPQRFRASLAEKGVAVGLPAIRKKFESQDGTVRYLVEFSDGQSVETVWMPEGDDGEAGDGTEAGDAAESGARSWDRATICISSQV